MTDFTVLSADIMTIPAAQILASHVVMTIIGGEVVYSREASSGGGHLPVE